MKVAQHCVQVAARAAQADLGMQNNSDPGTQRPSASLPAVDALGYDLGRYQQVRGRGGVPQRLLVYPKPLRCTWRIARFEASPASPCVRRASQARACPARRRACSARARLRSRRSSAKAACRLGRPGPAACSPASGRGWRRPAARACTSVARSRASARPHTEACQSRPRARVKRRQPRASFGHAVWARAYAAVAEVQAYDELLENPAGLGLCEPRGLVPQHVAEQVAAGSILHRDGKVGARQEHLRSGAARSAAASAARGPGAQGRPVLR